MQDIECSDRVSIEFEGCKKRECTYFKLAKYRLNTYRPMRHSSLEKQSLEDATLYKNKSLEASKRLENWLNFDHSTAIYAGHFIVFSSFYNVNQNTFANTENGFSSNILSSNKLRPENSSSMKRFNAATDVESTKVLVKEPLSDIIVRRANKKRHLGFKKLLLEQICTATQRVCDYL